MEFKKPVGCPSRAVAAGNAGLGSSRDRAGDVCSCQSCSSDKVGKCERHMQGIKDQSLRDAYRPLEEKAQVKEPEKCAESGVRMGWGRLRKRGVNS